LGFFDTGTYDQDKVGQLLFPACTAAVTSSGCAKANLIAINPQTGKQYPFAQVGTFDPASYASEAIHGPERNSTSPASGTGISTLDLASVLLTMSLVMERWRFVADSACSTAAPPVRITSGPADPALVQRRLLRCS